MTDVSWHLAFFAGLVAFFTPCFLPLVPAYISYLSRVSIGRAAGRWHTLVNAFCFVLGFSMVFVGLGASIGFVGFFFSDQMPLVRKGVGIALMVLGAMMIVGPFILRYVPVASLFYRDVRPIPVPFGKNGGYLVSFALGVSFSLAWSPCVGPVLGGILTLAYDSATAKEGALLLLVFSSGLAVPFLASALAVGALSRVFKVIQRFGRLTEIVNGAALIVFGYLVYSDKLVQLNTWFESFNFVYRWT